MLDTAIQLIKEGGHLVLATCREDQPHCSLMSYVSDDEGRRIYMLTESHTRKYMNMQSNPKISLLLDTRSQSGGGDRVKALTITGVFRPILDRKIQDEMRRRLLERHPDLSQLAERPSAEVVCVEAISFLLLDGVSEAHYLDL